MKKVKTKLTSIICVCFNVVLVSQNSVDTPQFLTWLVFNCVRIKYWYK